VGETERDVEIADGSSLADLFQQLAAQHPALVPLRPYTTYARNREVVPEDTRLEAGDEVAFLQPVSGGMT
jgi:molybdopterin converting factor small subunit